jgi:hypothetical protein
LKNPYLPFLTDFRSAAEQITGIYNILLYVFLLTDMRTEPQAATG